MQGDGGDQTYRRHPNARIRQAT